MGMPVAETDTVFACSAEESALNSPSTSAS
jgi:hypothetical protein